MINNYNNIILCFLFLLFRTAGTVNADVPEKSILYLNSYNITYAWGDSVTAGIIKTIEKRTDITLYVEYLDSKRFGDRNFKDLFNLFLSKYKNTDFDLAITSDNDALNFLFQYGDSLIPNIPVVFCGINNPTDYKIENSRFYGISEGVDLDSVNQLLIRIMPDIEKLYFILDNTRGSLENMKYLKSLEPKYQQKVKFEYIINLSFDTLFNLVRKFEENSAIALINIFQDINEIPVNSDYITQKISQFAPIPVFVESETSLGKGILGGIINSGYVHGVSAAELAIRFIDNPGFVPLKRVTIPKDNYYFDYKIIKKFNIDKKLLPPESIIINNPDTLFLKYLKYIGILIFIVALLIFVVVSLVVNIRRRKKAEILLNEKYHEIREQNMQLEEANNLVQTMYSELEETNQNLSKVNEELQVASDKAKESDQLKTAFLANMSHEIRTPLNTIVGFSNLLNDPDLTLQNRQQFYNMIKSSGEILTRLIDDILDLSKIEAGQLPVFKELFWAQEVMYEIINYFRHNNKNSGVDIFMSEYASRVNIKILTDRVRFRQILTNLVSNAFKFTQKGSIEIGFTTSESGVIFFVKDSGIGIEKKDLVNIFERFWKLNSLDIKINTGSGLGLSICKNLIRLLGGKIWVESKPDVGSTFYFSLANYYFFNEIHDNEKQNSVITIGKNWKGKTIAIVEDDETNLAYLLQILKNYKVGIVSFHDGIEIVEYFNNNNRNKLNLILMDIKLPGIDGYKATNLIRKIQPDIPVIAQTAYAMSNDIDKINKSGFNDYITKPIKPEDLLEKINKYL